MEDKPSFIHPQSQNPQVPLQGIPDTSNETLSSQIQELNEKIDLLIQTHKHDGLAGRSINFNTDILGFIEVVSVIPAATPTQLFGQIKIYVNGATKTLYLYDYVNHAWRSVTLT